MKTKTLTTNNVEEFDNLVNTFNETHNVKFSQHSTVYDFANQEVLYTMVVFYE